MPEGSFLRSLQDQLAGLSPARLVLLGITALASLGFLLWIALDGQRGDPRLLFRGIPEDELAKVADALDAEKIPYQIGEGGTAILVPGERVYEARMRVASRGLPAGGGVGLEIFDKPAFGVTDFIHRVNYGRALQGELARSIQQLDPVARARVQIALPERRGVLSDANRRASASVVVALKPSRELERSQVQGIVHLVASSIEGLEAGRVTVVDDRGRLLAPSRGELGAGAPEGASEHQGMVEGDLAQRVQSILEPVVGPGGVVAHVRAEMDFTRRETTEERFDPEGQVARSEQISKETSSDASGGTGGVAGVASNAPGAPGGVASSPSGASTSERSSETTNYEITKTTTRQVAPQGEIRRLHVAVLVDGKPGEDGSVAPFEEAELKRFEELAKHAVGFSGERGDQITVTSVPFRTVDVAAEGGWFDPSIFALLGSLLRGAAMVVAVLLFARLVVAPLLAAARAAQAGAVLPGSAGVSIAVGDEGAVALPAGAAAAPLPLPPEQATLSDRVGQLARQRSDDSVRTIRGWLNQR